MRAVAVLLLVLSASAAAAADEPRVRVGISLHPYYSWVATLGEGTPIEAVPLLPPGVDIHSYRPTPRDLERLFALDAVVLNALGHDQPWIEALESAAPARLRRIELHRGVPLLPYARGASHGHQGEETPPAPSAMNPHTFVSLLAAVQQIYNLERELAMLAPAHAPRLRANARAYARRLRGILASALARLADAKVGEVATLHDGYGYLLQELGIRVGTVIQPRHGIEPSAQELAGTVEAIRKAGVAVVFSELDFPPRYLDAIRSDTGVAVVPLTHLSKGPYSAGGFEEAMQANCDAIVRALVGRDG